MIKRRSPSLKEEKRLWGEGFVVVGVDEVGRGALAGPIVTAAAAFAPQVKNSKLKIKNWKGRINDSKRLTVKERERVYKWLIKTGLDWAVGKTTVSKINEAGIQEAYYTAVRYAVGKLARKIDGKGQLFVLSDYFYIKYLKGVGLSNQKAIVKGDEKSISIAAASIVAKVERDRIMRKLSEEKPRYGWDKNKGYGTKEHIKAIKKYGPTKHHREFFLRKILSRD